MAQAHGIGWAARIAAAALALGGLAACHREVTADQAEKLMGADPSVARYMAAMKQYFPDDYRRLLTTAAANANAGMPVEQARAQGFAISQGLIAQHQHDIARAPDGDLLALLRAQEALLGRVDTGMCARLFTGSVRPTETMPDAAKPLMADVGVANLRAARAGMDHPATRPAGVAPADLAALRERMHASSLSPEQLAIFERNGLMAAAPADQCAIGRAVDGAIVSLPPAQGARLASAALGAG